MDEERTGSAGGMLTQHRSTFILLMKRQRTGRSTFVQKQARPIDKELKVVNQVATVTVGSTTLKTTTFPCTVVGLRWSIAANALTAAETLIYWAIVIVRDGESANTPATSDGADFYTPEQNVLAFGMGRTESTAVASDQTVHWEGSTKTMRKMKQGDLLQFITLDSAANGDSIDGIVQFFCKS